MSNEKVELVRRFFEATERMIASYWKNPRSLAEAVRADEVVPEAEEAWKLLDSGFVWNTAGFGIYRGRVEIAAAWDEIFDVVDDYRAAVTDVVDGAGDLVFAAVERTAKAKGSGIDATFPIFMVITVRDGKIIRIDEVADRREALQAAGVAAS